MKRLTLAWGRGMYRGMYMYLLVGLAIVIAGLFLCPQAAYAAGEVFSVETSINSTLTIVVESRSDGTMWVRPGDPKAPWGWTNWRFDPVAHSVIWARGNLSHGARLDGNRSTYAEYLGEMKALAEKARDHQGSAANKRLIQKVIDELQKEISAIPETPDEPGTPVPPAGRGVVKGVARDSNTNELLSNVTIRLRPVSPTNGTQAYTTTTDSNGYYELDGVTMYVQNGTTKVWVTYKVMASLEGYHDYEGSQIWFSESVTEIVYDPYLSADIPLDGSISGRVYDKASNRSLAGVTVTLSPHAYGSGTKDYTTTTDASGNYAVREVTRRVTTSDGQVTWISYKVTVKEEGYEDYASSWLAFSPTVLDITHDVGLTPESGGEAPIESGTVKGRVFDMDTGMPLAGVRVVLMGKSQLTRTTDSNGNYAFSPVARYDIVEGEWMKYDIYAAKQGYEEYMTAQPLEFSDDVLEITHDIELIPLERAPQPGTIKGRVTSTQALGVRVPLADVTVVLLGDTEEHTFTDSNGYYAFTNLDRGDAQSGWTEYNLAVGKAGYKNYYTAQPLKFSEAVTVITHDVTLTPLASPIGTIRGTVFSYVRGRSERFAGATVTLTSTTSNLEYETTTNSNGEYLFNVPTDLSYTLHVVEEDHNAFHSNPLTFSQGVNEIRYDVIVQYIWWGPGTISGYVYDASTKKAISGAAVTASGLGRGGTLRYRAKTNSQGYYELTGVTRYGQSSGGAVTYISYILSAKARRYRSYNSDTFSFSDKVHGITHDIPMQRGSRRASVDINANGDDETVFASIQEAIDNADDNAVITIKPAVYMENIDVDRPITLAAVTGAAMPEIRGNGSVSSVYVHDTDGTVKITGLKITNGGTGYVNSDYTNGGIYATRVDNVVVEASAVSDNFGSGVFLGEGVGAATLANNVLSNNTATLTTAGGISITSRGDSAQYRILNNLIVNNSGQVSGGVYAVVLVSDPSATLEVVNNTIAYNVSEKSGYGGGILAVSNQSLKLKNNIIYGNTVKIGDSSALRKNLYLFNALSKSDGIDFESVTYNNIGGLESEYGSRAELGNNIDVDPMFISKADLHLSSQSPCIDAGNPDDSYSKEPQPNGGRIDMGAYGNTPEATTSILADDEVKNKPPEITFARKLSNFMIYWKGNDEEDGSSLVYSYRVDGGRWTTWDKRYFLIIRRLQGSIGGSQHTFEIKAKDSDGAESLPKSLVF